MDFLEHLSTFKMPKHYYWRTFSKICLDLCLHPYYILNFMENLAICKSEKEGLCHADSIVLRYRHLSV